MLGEQEEACAVEVGDAEEERGVGRCEPRPAGIGGVWIVGVLVSGCPLVCRL